MIHDPLIFGFFFPSWEAWYVRLFFIFLNCFEMGSCYVTQVGLKLLGSSDCPALASQSAGITGMSRHAQQAWVTQVGKFSNQYP